MECEGLSPDNAALNQEKGFFELLLFFFGISSIF